MELLERFAAGDIEAFESLFREHQSRVYRWIMRIVRNTATAEDLTVETFWRFYKAHARFDPQTKSCGAWLRRIATNVALDHLRRVRREVPLVDDIPAAGHMSGGEQRELREQIRREIGRLSPPLRIAVTLALVEEQPYGEIADALGISVNAVKVRVFRGTRQLRKNLEAAGIRP